VKINNPLIMLAIVVALSGCSERSRETTTASEAPPAATETGAVAFDPAYPEEVSTETLSPADTAQQEIHKHGDGEDAHAHDAETKTDHGHPH
jgi:hypothetical protein